MKTTIDWKSAALGLCVGVLAVFAMGAGEQPAREVGRYQIVIGGNPPVFLVVDTTTGRVWMGNGMANQLKSDNDFFSVKSP